MITLFSNIRNLLFLADGYKLDHRRQYPKKTQYVYSNNTCRASRIKGQNWTIAFGLQYFLLHYLTEVANETFFNRPKDEVLREYQEFLNNYLGPNDIGVEHIGALHDLGYIPLEFHAVPEGTKVPLRMPHFTMINTHPDFFWVTNYFETIIASVTWMGINSATIANRYRTLLDEAAARQGYSREFVQWQGHDFSFRGMPGSEAAMISGAGHLLSFTGTDTIPAIQFLEKYYSADGLIAGSVAATEHSVMMAGGETDELETFDRLFDLYPNGIVSIVSDTWNIWTVLTEYVPALKDKILARNGKWVCRPDSGNPVLVVAGNPKAPEGSPENKGVVQLLWDTFGGTMLPSGLRELDPHVGVIYGDAITEVVADEIIKALEAKGFAASNIVFGIGSFTYQYNTRDTFAQAIKATWAQIDGEEQMLEKHPVTDSGVKFSATGKIQLFQTPTGIEMRDGLTDAQWKAATYDGGFGKDFPALLQPVWRDGKFLRTQTLEDIRYRVLNNPAPVDTDTVDAAFEMVH